MELNENQRIIYDYLEPQIINHSGNVIDTIIWWSKSYPRMFSQRKDVFEAYRGLNTLQENEVIRALIEVVEKRLA